MSNNTRITDLEPVDMTKNEDTPSYVYDDRLVELVQNGDNVSAKISDIRAAIVNQLYPVGSIYQSTEPDNPSIALNLPNSTWRLYGQSKTGSYGAPAALFGYKENDSSFTVSETIRGLDTSSISGGYIDWKRHWGWKRLRISNFSPHAHGVELSKLTSSWVWFINDEEGYDTVETIDIALRHGYGILTSLPPVIGDIIEKRNLGTTTTNILKDPRVDEVKINGKTVKVDTSNRQFVTYDGKEYIYCTVAQMKSKTKDGDWAINKGTTNVNKWLLNQAPLHENSLGKIAIPDAKAGSNSVKYPNYNPIANPITGKKNGVRVVRVKANNAAGYTDIDNFTVGDWVEYTDSEGVTAQIVYSKDYEVTEKNNTITVKTVNKWIPYHDVWQNKYWGRINTDITTSSGKLKPGVTLIEEKNNSDPTLGFYGTVLGTPKKISAHAGDIVSYKYGEYIYNPIKSELVVPVKSTTSANEYDLVEITANTWAREDTGIDAMTKDIPEDHDVGQDYPRAMVRPENEPDPEQIPPELQYISQIEVGNQSDEHTWDTGAGLRLVGSDRLANVTDGYGVLLWPNEITQLTPEEISYITTHYFSEINDCANPQQAQSLIQAFRSYLYSILSEDDRWHSDTTKTDYYPEYPALEYTSDIWHALEGPTVSSDSIEKLIEWHSHTVDNWEEISKSEKLSDDMSHTVGTIVDVLPPYVTAYRWVRIS